MAIATYRSRRARILYALQRVLEGITVANGFSTDVYKVTTSVKTWNAVPEHESPTLYLVDENTQYDYSASKTALRTWTIGIYGVMKNKDQYAMEELIADIEECLIKNLKLSYEGVPGPVSYSRILNIITDNQLFSEIEGSQLFKISLALSYTACADQIR